MSDDSRRNERCPHGIRWPHECKDCLHESSFAAPHGSARLFSTRQTRLSEIRAIWAIKQQQATQLAHAIEVLSDINMADDAALSVAEKILNANIGP